MNDGPQRPKTSWELKQEQEKRFDEQVRNLMTQRRITYQEAEQMIKAGQTGLCQFKGFK